MGDIYNYGGLQMKNNSLKGIILLLITAFVWGVAFVAQSSGMEHMNAFAFNSIRNMIGAIVLLPVLFVSLRKKNDTYSKDVAYDRSVRAKKSNSVFFTKHKDLLMGGLVCGTALCIASNLQQLGMQHSTVGKSAFITTLYIVFVPIVGIFLKKKVPLQVWFGVLIAMAGLYLLCMKEETFVLSIGDIYLLLCAFFFTFQIMLVEHYVQKVNGLALSILQFFVTSIFSGICMIFTEIPSITDISNCAIPLLYAGGISCGIGYTLQIIGQKYVPSTIASLIMSLESVIAALAGWFLLHEVLTQKELIGCGLVFIAVLLTQIPVKSKKSIGN